MRTIDDAARYPEGPLWCNGELFYVEFAAHRVSRWNRDAKTEFWHEPGSGPCALGAVGNDLLLCAYDADALIRIDAGGRTVARRDRDADGNPFIGPNDLTPDGAGGFYFTASGRFDVTAPATGAVLHIDPDGTIRRLADGLHYANGIAFDAARRYLFVSEHLAARIVIFEVQQNGTLDGPRLFCGLPEIAPHPRARDAYAGGDGIKLDARGRLVVAHFGTGRLLAIADNGTLVRAIELPLAFPTNIALDPETGAAAVTAVADPWNAPFGGAVFHLEPDLLA